MGNKSKEVKFMTGEVKLKTGGSLIPVAAGELVVDTFLNSDHVGLMGNGGRNSESGIAVKVAVMIAGGGRIEGVVAVLALMTFSVTVTCVVDWTVIVVVSSSQAKTESPA